MKNLVFIVCAAFFSLLAACASNPTKLKVHQINALSSLEQDDGSFKGLEFLADQQPGDTKSRINVFYLHGIGWTEDPKKEQLGNNFLAAIARAYDLDSGKKHMIESRCGANNNPNDTQGQNHIYITATDQSQYYETLIPGARLKLDQLACMDRQTLEIDPALEFVVYRIFWDNSFWNQLQRPHVGQDDARENPGGVARLRTKYNRLLKDELVNYGFSDAVMYLGPAGEEIRSAIRGAMCSAALDAGGYHFDRQGEEISYDRACATASNTTVRTNQFAYVSESLGSKITYDIMRGALTDGRDTVLDEMIGGSEFFMIANQLALLSLSDLSRSPAGKAQIDPDKPRPKIIALSEVNDLLTYEINPFLEQLWTSQSVSGDGAAPFDAQARQTIIEALGFDVVDVRLEFADQIIPMYDGFVDPLQAHSDHALEPYLMLYILCGTQSGQLKEEGCLATSDF